MKSPGGNGNGDVPWWARFGLVGVVVLAVLYTLHEVILALVNRMCVGPGPPPLP